MTTEVECVETDGLLRVCNVWMLPGFTSVYSMLENAGMIVEAIGVGETRYRCHDDSDVHSVDDFSDIVFSTLVV